MTAVYATREDRIIAALSAHRFRAYDEPSLHEAVADVLHGEGLAFEHEARLGPRARVDFLVSGTALEIKLGGTEARIVAQLARYAASPRVNGLLLVTTRACFVRVDGMVLNGKRVRVIRLAGGLV